MDKYTTADFDRDFPDNDSCLEWLFHSRWPKGVPCEKCQKVTTHYRIKGRPCYSCEFCGSHVYPMAQTIFAGTKFSHLRLWFKAVAYMAITRCGISSRQLSRDIGVGVKTGWRMFHQIRKVLAEKEITLIGAVEMDETYIGGVRRGKRGRGAEAKTAVVGLAQIEAEMQKLTKKADAFRSVIAHYEQIGENEESTKIPHSFTGQYLADSMQEILEQNGKPLHFKEIHRRLEASGVRVTGKDPIRNTGAHLSLDKRFDKWGKGMWGLRKWKNKPSAIAVNGHEQTIPSTKAN